jgi:hypothetical protein
MHLVEKIIIIVILIIIILRHVDVIKQRYLIIKLCFRAKKNIKFIIVMTVIIKKIKRLIRPKSASFRLSLSFLAEAHPRLENRPA